MLLTAKRHADPGNMLEVLLRGRCCGSLHAAPAWAHRLAGTFMGRLCLVVRLHSAPPCSAALLMQVLEAAEMPVFCTLRTRKRCELTG